MDLRLMDAAATRDERAAVDERLGAPRGVGEGGAATDRDHRVVRAGGEARARRHLLLPALLAVQDRIGWISPGALNYVCRRLSVPPAEAYSVASFYALLATRPRPERVAHVCDDLACRIAGAGELCAALEQSLDGEEWERSPCLGHCERAPAVLLQAAGEGARTVAPAGAEVVSAALAGRDLPAGPPPSSVPQAGEGGLRLLRRVGVIDPGRLDDYLAHGGGTALRRAAALGPQAVIGEVVASGLVGRGGAAFPTGRKWEAVAAAGAGPRYVICNGDESEPGTFKDRVLMEEDPFAVLEAMAVAGFAVGAEAGYLYVRGEYPLAARRLGEAIEQCRGAGMLGADVLGLGFAFDVELRRGAGAYICGEETALMNSIEGFRGEPRSKPPFPTEAGLFGRPTVVNNVETLVNVLDIVAEGGEAFAALGVAGATGTKLFSVSGSVNRPGVYEVRFGTTIGELLDLAGGLPAGRTLQAVLLGGAAGTFLGPDHLDVPLSFAGVRAAGATLGSGAVLAFDDGVDLADIVLRIAAFFRDESCGKCVPCRVGTVRQEELLRRLVAGSSRPGDRALLEDIGLAMGDASICGLGQTAALAVESAVTGLGLFEGSAG